MRIEQHIAGLGLQLPPPPAPQGDYVPVMTHGSIAYVSGQLSRESDAVVSGPAGPDTPEAHLVRAAQACVLRAVSALAHELGDLDAVDRVLFLRGFVNAVPEYQHHTKVLDHASALLRDIFGPQGPHARSAVGVASLPGGGLLEVELTVALKSGGQTL